MEFFKEIKNYNSQSIRHIGEKYVVHKQGTQVSVTSPDVLTIDDTSVIEKDVSVVETVAANEDDPTFAPFPSTFTVPPAKDQHSSDENIPCCRLDMLNHW